MARKVGKMRGDMRAMEEQMTLPQSNPVRGGGATPSMGLSQFRGGGDMGRVVGAGFHRPAVERPIHYKGRGKKGEAMRMGHALGTHINQLHGGGFFDDFKRGFDSVVAPIAGVAKTFLPLAGPQGMLASGVINALGYGRSRSGCGTGAGQLMITHGGGRERDDVAMLSGMGYGMGYTGCGEDTEEEEEMEGGQSFANPSSMSMSGAYQGQGTGGRRRRASAGPNDGRRKRAEVVKRVMAEKGMKMIEASKYVKAHGLY